MVPCLCRDTLAAGYRERRTARLMAVALQAAGAGLNVARLAGGLQVGRCRVAFCGKCMLFMRGGCERGSSRTETGAAGARQE